MKIFVICSKQFYDRIPEIQEKLEAQGHTVSFPVGYDDPEMENRYRNLGNDEHSKWKAEMFKKSLDVINANDAILVLNFEKNNIENYIGGATFLEMYDAFRLGKKIFMYNGIPEGILKDEIIGFHPTLLNSDMDKVL